MRKQNSKKIIIVSGSLTIILFLILFSIRLTSYTETEKNNMFSDSNIKQKETQIPQRKPSVYRRGPFRFENGEFIRKDGEFVSWEELEKQGIMIVKDGELSTPWPESDYGPDNTLAQENIDGIVILPEEITSIEERTLPSSLLEIGDNVFKNCRKLSHVTISGNLKKIGSAAFRGCILTDLKVPDTVDSIGAGAFGEVSHIQYKGPATYGNNDKFWGADSLN